jgi:hypothetical protein
MQIRRVATEPANITLAATDTNITHSFFLGGDISVRKKKQYGAKYSRHRLETEQELKTAPLCTVMPL